MKVDIPIIKMWIGMLLLQCGTASSAHAQYVPETIIDSTHLKNAIGLYLTTPLVILMGGNVNRSRLGVIYRRSVKPNRSFRAQAVFDFNDVNDNDGVLSTITMLTDTNMTYYYAYDKDVTSTVRLGYEWSNPDKVVTAVYGVDLMLGLGYYSLDERSISYFRDTTITSIAPDFSRAPIDVQTRNYQRYDFYIGFDFTIGCRVNIKDHFSLVGQFSPEFLYSPATSVKYGPITQPTVNTLSGLIDFRFRPVEVILFYRF